MKYRYILTVVVDVEADCQESANELIDNATVIVANEYGRPLDSEVIATDDESDDKA